MNLKYRKTIIAGNWKMNLNAEEAKKFITQLKTKAAQAKWCDVVLCVPFLQIPAAVRAAKHTKIAIGAQNCHFEENGAYTGEISCKMLVEAGVKYVIIGHSERRRDNNETDTTVNKKVLAALQAGLRPIICVGETLEMRDNDVTLDVVRMQVKTALRGVSIIGGGDSAAAIAKMGYSRYVTPISTGGGASLNFLQGTVLPGIACLDDKE